MVCGIHSHINYFPGFHLPYPNHDSSSPDMKDYLFKMWYDTTHPTTISLLVGDYHQIGLWMSAGGKVVAFDPAPTLAKGLLTPQRIKKGKLYIV